MKKYEVTFMPCDRGNIPNKIVNSLKEAEAYIKEHICDYCKGDLDRGYLLADNNDGLEVGEEIKFPIKYPSETMCGAEFWIEEVEDDS
jgi:hypothetical protein